MGIDKSAEPRAHGKVYISTTVLVPEDRASLTCMGNGSERRRERCIHAVAMYDTKGITLGAKPVRRAIL